MSLVKHEAGRFRNRIREFTISGTCLFSFFLPLLLWPSIEHPFSTPKWWLLGGWSVALISLLLCLRKQNSSPALATREIVIVAAWVAALSVSALTAPVVSLRSLLCAIMPIPWFLALRIVPDLSERMVKTLLWTSAVLSLVALLQYAEMDPFIRLFGWQPEKFPGSRMRVYGTLGNPNFVAAWLCATLPLHLPGCFGGARPKSKGTWIAGILMAIQFLAIVATGSRVLLIAMGIILLVLLVFHRKSALSIAVPIALASMIWLFWAGPARSLGNTLAGRWFIAGTVLEHWKEIPVFGFGAGIFPEQFARWQYEWLQKTGAGDPRLQYASPLDHAHNDYLEFLVNYGYAGLTAFLLFWFLLLKELIKPLACFADKNLLAARISAPLILSAIALVDFPFQRPAEWGLFWILLGLALERES